MRTMALLLLTACAPEIDDSGVPFDCPEEAPQALPKGPEAPGGPSGYAAGCEAGEADFWRGYADGLECFDALGPGTWDTRPTPAQTAWWAEFVEGYNDCSEYTRGHEQGWTTGGCDG